MLWTFFFFFLCLLVRKVCDGRWVPLFCVWKIEQKMWSWKKKCRIQLMIFLQVVCSVSEGLFSKERIKFPKAISDHDPLPDWVRDLIYVHSQPLSRSTSRICTLRCNGPVYKGANHVPKALCIHKSSESGFLGRSWSITPWFRISKAWFERPLHSQRVKSGFQIRNGSETRSETAFRTWFARLWTGP